MNRREFMGAAAMGGAAMAMPGAGRAGQGCDLALKDVKALIGGGFKSCDLGVTGEKISAIAEPGSLFAGREISGAGLFVSPGWVDLHVHYVDWTHRKTAGSPISRLGRRLGVTAMVDAGTVGAKNYDRLEKAVGKNPEVPCYSWLSIKKEGIKLTDFYTTRTGYDDIPAMERVIDEHKDRIVGFKLRADNQVSARDDRLYYVRKIREAGDRYHLPCMIHIGGAPPSLLDILPFMKEGDLVTHFLRGQGNSIIGPDGQLLTSVKDAFSRGVRFDAGHGMGSFTFADAERALDQGFDDFTISSDLYIMSAWLYAKTFANVLTQFLAVGLPLEGIMERASTRPAKVIGLEREIKVGAEASLTVFSVASGNFTCTDVTRKTRKSEKRIIPEWTLVKGEISRAGDLDRKKFL